MHSSSFVPPSELLWTTILRNLVNIIYIESDSFLPPVRRMGRIGTRAEAARTKLHDLTPGKHPGRSLLLTSSTILSWCLPARAGFVHFFPPPFPDLFK